MKLPSRLRVAMTRDLATWGLPFYHPCKVKSTTIGTRTMEREGTNTTKPTGGLWRQLRRFAGCTERSMPFLRKSFHAAIRVRPSPFARFSPSIKVIRRGRGTRRGRSVSLQSERERERERERESKKGGSDEREGGCRLAPGLRLLL